MIKTATFVHAVDSRCQSCKFSSMSAHVLNVGCRTVQIKPSNSIVNDTFVKKWKCHYGISPVNTIRLWNRILDNEYDLCLNHFFWGLLLIKLYQYESVASNIVGVDEKTWRKWAWYAVDIISQLEAEMVSDCYEAFKKIRDSSIFCVYDFSFRLILKVEKMVMRAMTASCLLMGLIFAYAKRESVGSVINSRIRLEFVMRLAFASKMVK